MLPVDNQTTNEYINALKEQFGQIRRTENKSIFFTCRRDTGESISIWYPLFEQRKILDRGNFMVPSIISTAFELDYAFGADSGLYQIWTGDVNYIVSGAGVSNIDNGIWVIPSGAEVTVTQNGGAEPPSAINFLPVGDPAFAYVMDDGGSVAEFLPYHGKAYYGNLILPAEEASDLIQIALVRPDRTFNAMSICRSEVDQLMIGPVFFTHISCENEIGDIWFIGKEFTFVDSDFPTDSWVEPEFTYVPD